MLYALEGKVVEKRDVHVFLNVNGLVFDILVAPSFAEELIVGAVNFIYVSMVVFEESVVLYGFKTSEEREIFSYLIKLQGIGPNLVFRIMSALSVEELKDCLEKGDVNRLSQIKGVGTKRAERIIFEAQGITIKTGERKVEESVRSKAISALMSLGLREQDATSLVDKAIKSIGKPVNLEELIKAALGGGGENN
ncbi:MAG: Holliday junction branch migration protein RuvA [bacterium]|nr:Holliday junction branch migration protein RuvA [bacterium]